MDSICKFPEACISGKICDNINKKIHCCWHQDLRKNKNMIYIDGYGEINVSKLNIVLPDDLFYCPSCKMSPENPVVLMEEIKNKISEFSKIKMTSHATINSVLFRSSKMFNTKKKPKKKSRGKK